MLTLRNLLMLAILTVVFTACDANGLTGPDDSTDTAISRGFVGNWAASNWTKTGIQDGNTTVTGSTDSLFLAYSVNLNHISGGVSHRTATYRVTAPMSGTVAFDWEYTGYHAYFRAFAELKVQAGAESMVMHDDTSRGHFAFSGSASIAVTEGQPLEFQLGGRNGDRDSRLDGSVKLTNFRLLP